MNFDFFKNDLFVTEIVLAIFVRSGMGAPVHRNRASHGLVFICDGENKYDFSTGESISVGKNDVLYLPKGSNYTVSGNGECYAVNFQLSKEISTSPFVIPVKNASSVAECFKTAESCYKKRQSGYAEKCCRELYEIIIELRKIVSTSSYLSYRQKEIVDKAVAYIGENYTSDKIRMSDLSRVCSVSDVYLRRLFECEFGISPVEYINRMRLTYAKELILSTACSVTEVCFLSGFCDTSYFSRAFKRFFGMSPMEMKKYEK